MIEMIIITAICIAGSSYTAYHTGLRAGTEKMLSILHEQKIIRFDDEGNILPNPIFDP